MSKAVLAALVLYALLDLLIEADKASRLQVRSEICSELKAWNHPACQPRIELNDSGPPNKF